MLIDGEYEADGDLYVGMSAYEMRMKAQSGSGDFTDLILDAAQLDRSVQAGIVKDWEVRVAMLLRIRGGYDEHEIEQMLGSKRPGYALLQRGAELIRRHERGEHAKLRRVRANRGENDNPVCWKCLKTAVARPGDYCGCGEPAQRSRRSKTGPGSTYDPADQPEIADMTPEERAAEIDLLTATQEKGPIPGGEHYRKRVSPVGSRMFDPDDLRRADRAYQRGHARDVQRPSTPPEQIPSD